MGNDQRNDGSKIFRKEDMIRRCMICNTIELEGKLLGPDGYNPNTLQERGFYFSDVLLSVECAKVTFEDLWEEKDNLLVTYSSCKKI